MKAKKFTYGDKTLYLHLLTTVGSQLHQLNLKNSDVHLKGVFVWDSVSLSQLTLPQTSLDKKMQIKNIGLI